MDRITCTLKSETGQFAVPYSTGYQTYSGLLSLIDDTDSQLAGELHSAPFASLTNSGLLGSFDWGVKRDYHKGIHPDAEYTLEIGITHPDDQAVFNALTKALIIDDAPLELAHGSLRVTEVQTESRTHQDLLTEATKSVAEGANGVGVQFETPTCCSRYGDVWEAHPDRVYLFKSLADRWNATTTDDQQLSPTKEALGKELFTIADTDQYDTHSIVVHRQEPEGAASDETGSESAAPDGGQHLNEVQGFTGRWTFQFKGASEATKTAVLALSKFAEFAGVGRHTARGAGTVSVTVEGI
jgi:hypothetical protein